LGAGIARRKTGVLPNAYGLWGRAELQAAEKDAEDSLVFIVLV